MKDFQLAIFGICLSVAILISTLILSNTALQVKRYAGESLTVTGAASQKINSNQAKWTANFYRRATSQAEAYRLLMADQKQVLAFLNEQGIKEDAVNLGAVNTMLRYHRNSNDIKGYELSQNIAITSTDVTKVTDIAKKSSNLISQGLDFRSNAPQYYYTKLDEIKVSLLKAATQNARARAASMADSSGRKVGALRQSRMGVFQITGETSTDVSDYGIYDTSSIRKKVTAVVNTTFDLAQ
ncbi:MAG: SIMPL domain-containing protein [Vampirovibrio sp.]|nr:SIMPL domain-containing protein [Vampirovibrio sp.]